MNQGASSSVVEHLYQISFLTWAQIWLALFTLIVLAIGIFMAEMNRRNLKRLTRSYSKKYDLIKNTLAELKQAGIAKGVQNNNRSESRGGNQKGGNQTVNITTEPARTPTDFQRILLDRVTETCRDNKIEIERLQRRNSQLEQQLQLSKSNHTNNNERKRSYPNRRTQT